MIAALGGFGLLQSIPISTVLAIIGLVLVAHGSYEVFFKPNFFLKWRITKWLKGRDWAVTTDKNPQFYFIIWAEDSDQRKIAITRSKDHKNILTFNTRIRQGENWETKLSGLTTSQRARLIEEMKIFFASKNLSYDGAVWPFDKLAAQTALPLDSNLSAHLVDVKAKEIIFAIIGVRSIVRKAIEQQR